MKSNDVSIHKMQISDIQDVLNIEKNQDIHILNQTMLETSINLPNSIYYIAKSDNIIVGYIGATLLFDHIDIESIVTKHEHKRQGIATLLLHHILHIARENNINDIFLEVRISNAAAKNLYEKLGFKNISVRKNYYRSIDSIEDAAVYLLKI